jgi:hypothetical protein
VDLFLQRLHSRPKLAGNTDATVSTLFKLLGWAFAESVDKCVPFSSSCEALGVSFDLSASSKGYASICNTAGRVDELCADLDNVLREGTLSSKQAQRLRGRMQFADAQLFGRTGKRCLKSLSDFSEGRRVRLQPKDCLFLRLFSSLLKQNVPREVRALDSYSTVFFTDAMKGTTLPGLAELEAFSFAKRRCNTFLCGLALQSGKSLASYTKADHLRSRDPR